MTQGFTNTAAATSILLLAGLATAPAVSAQSEDQIRDLLACEKIKNSADKLECYDAVIAILKQREANRPEGSARSQEGGQRQSSVDVRTSDFGLNRQQIEERDEQRNKKKAPKEQTFQFTHKWRDAAGRYYFLMTNGQVWKEVKGSHLIVPKRSKSIRIKRNIMGGFIAYIEGMRGRPGRVKRIR
ncbi:MAG: hypothetical protein JJ850_10555 [Kordiimonadaceae bacterium]|nr:hypothetical protein [Kordiimonadaceae bacterium]MBO6568974.1 hypothetical protein [Kordiimonadaceae bacterium]MBO6965051.1 hypothetical protein [Kordiimonadaceae bacterium]